MLWNSQYKDVKNIFKILHTYPNYLESAGIKKINIPSRMDDTQKKYLSLISQFYHPEEKKFYKSWWVQIDMDSIDYFIDLSDSKYPVFETKYYPFITGGWVKHILFQDISELLLIINDKEKLSLHLEKINYELIEKYI